MTGETITKEMCIREVIEKYPETEGIFKKYFGDECYTCPGSKHEDIYFGSMMHNVDPETVLNELNGAVNKDK